MSAEKEITKPRRVDLQAEQYNFEGPKRVHDRPKHFWAKVAVIGILTTGIALHTVSLTTPYLAILRTTLVFNDIYHFQHHDSRTTDIDIGLWKVCSDAWAYHCVSWAKSSEADTMIGGSGHFEAPGWLLGAQGTSITGLVVAVITDVIVLLYLLISDKCNRLFPFLICLGSLIGGTLVFISSACVAFNYKDLSTHEGLLLSLDNTAHEDLDLTKHLFSFFLGWGFAMEVVAIVLMWISGLVIVLGRRHSTCTDKSDDGKKMRLFLIFS